MMGTSRGQAAPGIEGKDGVTGDQGISTAEIQIEAQMVLSLGKTSGVNAI